MTLLSQPALGYSAAVYLADRLCLPPTDLRTANIAMPDVSLELIQQMLQRVLDSQRETREDVREIKSRLGRLEGDVANLHVFLAEQSVRLDRFADRLERVERRLDIADA
jgi:hypothetical protein